MKYVGYVLIVIGLYGFILSILHINMVSIVFAIITLIVGIYLSIESISKTNFKGKGKLEFVKSQPLPIGISALLVGFYQLLL